AVCRRQQWRLATWNIEAGLQGVEGDEHATGGHDPLAAIRASQELTGPEGAGVLILENFHRFLGSAEIVQALARRIQLGKRQRTFLVCLSPSATLPPELEKLFVVLNHPLPDRQELLTIAQELATAEELGDDLENVLSAAGGRTRYEAEAAYSLSLVRTGRLTAQVVATVKSQQLKQTNLVTLHEGDERFADLGGMEAIKTFCSRALRPGARCRPRGILLVSPPGCGKSALCKAIGQEVGRPTLRLDVGA